MLLKNLATVFYKKKDLDVFMKKILMILVKSSPDNNKKA